MTRLSLFWFSLVVIAAAVAAAGTLVLLLVLLLLALLFSPLETDSVSSGVRLLPLSGAASHLAWCAAPAVVAGYIRPSGPKATIKTTRCARTCLAVFLSTLFHSASMNLLQTFFPPGIIQP